MQSVLIHAVLYMQFRINVVIYMQSFLINAVLYMQSAWEFLARVSLEHHMQADLQPLLQPLLPVECVPAWGTIHSKHIAGRMISFSINKPRRTPVYHTISQVISSDYQDLGFQGRNGACFACNYFRSMYAILWVGSLGG